MKIYQQPDVELVKMNLQDQQIKHSVVNVSLMSHSNRIQSSVMTVELITTALIVKTLVKNATSVIKDTSLKELS